MFALGICYKYGDMVERNYDMAMMYFKLAIQLNNRNAKTELGVMYELGYGVEENKNYAYELYISAAKQGSPYAMMQCNYANVNY